MATPTTTGGESVTNIVQSLTGAVSNTTTAQVANGTANWYFDHVVGFEVISVLLTTVFIVGCVIIIRKIGWLRIRVDRFNDVILHSDPEIERARSSWDTIEQHFFAGSDNDLRVAIIDADKLLDNVLKKAGVSGVDLGDRLKKVKLAQLPNIEDVWAAHKIRNRIAHETNFALKRDLAEKVLTIYETAFVHLGVLDSQDDLSKKKPVEGEEEATGSEPHSHSSH